MCGYNLSFEPWKDDSPSDEICPSCGIHFGYDDHLAGNKDLRPAFYKGWRGKWRLDGYKWWSDNLPPANWNGEQQLKNMLSDSE